MNRILVITNGESDFLHLLKAHCSVTVISTETPLFDVDAFDALCIIAGNGESSLTLSAPMHVCVERMREKGKPVFCEFVGSIGATRERGKMNTARQRMVYYTNGLEVDGVLDGDLFDGQTNDCIKYAPFGAASSPILTYQEYICAHSNIQTNAEKHKEGTWALWWFDKSTLVSSIRLCNFNRARFAPYRRWRSLIASIISFLAGEKVELAFENPVCSYRLTAVSDTADVDSAVRCGLNWIINSGMLKNGGMSGAHEGFSNRIDARNGVQAKNYNVRTDCTCEIGGALMLDYLLTGCEKSKEASSALFKFAFDWLQVKDGEHRGMLRWSEVGWQTCFQDDAARAVIPPLLAQHAGCDVPHFDEILEALDYMLDTTGEDGIRVPCTEMSDMTPELISKLRKAGSGEPCAHFNAYYHAALLLAYRVCKKEKYLQYAERGLSTIMSHYPQTRRETSETEECCRLVFPLAVLYGVTRKQEHYDWLCRIVEDLEKFRHHSGGYAEWDTGYKAGCSRNHKGECALVANNGDPVADLLYSNNWLPLGFSYAYLVTGEHRFYDLWASVASFILSSQIHSDDKLIDGAWARAFDMEDCENYGMPHDAGWGPCCIESGWTVGEILIGLQFMHVVQNKNKAIT